MATRVRRPKGTPTKPAYYDLDPDVKDEIDALAFELNLPHWAVIGCSIRAVRRGASGVPIGWILPSLVRRPKGAPTKPAYYALDPDVKDEIDALAFELNLPHWAVIGCSIRAVRRGSDGVPVGWVLPDPTFPDVIDFAVIGGEAVLRRTA